MRDLVAVGGRPEPIGVFEPVVRLRVLDRLRLAARYPIALMIAPAGYGKSVALRHFLAEYQGPHVRYNVRGDNGTLLGFVRGLVEALEAVVPKAMTSLASAYGEGASPEAQAKNLAAWLYAHVKKYDGLIVVDDLHVARNDPAVSIFLADIIDRTREKAHWFIATRDSLELPIASWLAYGFADLPVDAIDLRFALDEARASAKAGAISIRDEELGNLLDITDGWATALSFALRASVRSVDLSAIASGTRDMVYRYLAEQVFRELPETHRQFLLATCVYPNIDLKLLADAGYDKASRILDDLRRGVAFLYADSDNVFRYHDLFRDFLEHELENRGRAAFLTAVKTAATHLEARGRISDALHLFVRGASSDDIVRLLRSSGFGLFERGHADALRAALVVLPEDVRDQEPVVLALRAVFEAREARLDRAETWFLRACELEREATQRVEITLRFVKALYHGAGQKQIDLLAPLMSLTNVEASTRADLLGTLANACAMSGRLKDAATHMEEATRLASGVSDDELRVRNLIRRAFVANLSSDYRISESLAADAAKQAESWGFYRSAAAAHGIVSSAALDGEDDHARALWSLRQMAEAAAKGGWPEGQFHALSMLLYCEAERGDDQILAGLDNRLAHFQSQSFFGAGVALAPANALRKAWLGDFEYAFQVLFGSAETQPSAQRRALRFAEIGVFSAAAGRRDEARSALEAAQAMLNSTAGPENPNSHRAMKATILCATAYLTMGQAASARRALALAERNKHHLSPRLATFLDTVRAIYVHTETQFATDELVEKLAHLRKRGYGGYARLLERLPFPATTAPSRFAALTKAELTVLRALARGGSSRIVAEETGRSAQTIDAHVKSIAKKLGCRGRREAISLARETGFIS